MNPSVGVGLLPLCCFWNHTSCSTLAAGMSHDYCVIHGVQHVSVADSNPRPPSLAHLFSMDRCRFRRLLVYTRRRFFGSGIHGTRPVLSPSIAVCFPALSCVMLLERTPRLPLAHTVRVVLWVSLDAFAWCACVRRFFVLVQHTTRFLASFAFFPFLPFPVLSYRVGLVLFVLCVQITLLPFGAHFVKSCFSSLETYFLEVSK